MTKEREALKALIHEMEYVLSCINAEEIPFDGDDFHEALRLGKEALDHLSQPEKDKERCVGCEACIDTACGRDECPKGWPKAAQPEQEPVALPCCGYTDASAIKWNPYNQVVQCHNCGQVYTTPPQRTAAKGEDTRRAWVGLDDIDLAGCSNQDEVSSARYWEAKLKEKNK